MSQIQRPNCGGYKITTPGANPGCGYIVLFGLGGFLLLLGLIENNLTGSLWPGIGLVVTGVLFTIIRLNYERTHHACLICGKIWETG